MRNPVYRLQWMIVLTSVVVAGMSVASAVWDQGAFFAGGYPLEATEKAASESDFAVANAQPDDIVETRRVRQPTCVITFFLSLGFLWAN